VSFRIVQAVRAVPVELSGARTIARFESEKTQTAPVVCANSVGVGRAEQADALARLEAEDEREHRLREELAHAERALAKAQQNLDGARSRRPAPGKEGDWMAFLFKLETTDGNPADPQR
jgi:hypothetical protein